MERPKAIITWGVSGSGKTTFTRLLTSRSRELLGSYTFGAERDSFRRVQLGSWGDPRPLEEGCQFSSFWDVWDEFGSEKAVTKAQEEFYKGLVKDWESVFISDTNLRSKTRKALVDLYSSRGYDVHMFRLDTPLDVCIERDKSRGWYSVGEDVIRKQHRVMSSQPLDSTVLVPYNEDHSEFLENYFG